MVEAIEKARLYFDKYSNGSEMINEANIRENVVVEVLIALGYQRENMVRESQPTDRRRQAMDIKIIDLGISNEELVIEVKRGDIELNYIHLEQTLSYLNKRTRFEWAILTNGREYQLINRRIEVKDYNIEHRIVETFSIYEENEQLIEKMKLFSCDNLYNSGTTNYYKYIQQYYAARYSDVFVRHFTIWRSGINSLVKYLISKYNGQYIDLDKLGKRDIEGFFDYMMENKSINSKSTLNSMYSFLDIFYETLLKSDGLKLQFNPLKHVPRQELLNKYKDLPDKARDVDILTDEEISQMFELIEQNRGRRNNPADRNEICLILLLHTGCTLRELIAIKMDDIDFKNDIIFIGEGKKRREIKLNTFVKDKLQWYINIRLQEHKRIKQQYSSAKPPLYLLSRYKGGKESIVSMRGIQHSLSENILKKIDIDDKERKSQLTISTFRTTFIKRLLESDVSIIDILYVAGLEPRSLGDYIPWDYILEKADRKKIITKHPFKGVYKYMEKQIKM